MKQTDLLLNREGVDAASQQIAVWLAETGVPKRDALGIRLTMEELLLRICEHYDGMIGGKLRMGKRFGVPFISVHYAGEAFDPTRKQNDEMSEWAEELLANMGLSPSWSRRFGQNKLIQTINTPKKGAQLMLPVSFLLALLAGLAGAVLPETARDTIS